MANNFAAINEDFVVFEQLPGRIDWRRHALKKIKKRCEKLLQSCGIASGRLVNDGENPYIPRVWRNFFHSLTRKREANELRMKQEFSMFQEGKCAVKVATTHAKPVAVVVKRNDGSNYEIKRSRCDDFAVLGLGKAVLIKNERAFGV